jgi:hypothetical protein
VSSDREQYSYLSDYSILYEKPSNSLTSTVLNDTAGATCFFKIYDVAKSQTLSAAEASGQTVLSVSDAGSIQVDDVVEVDTNSSPITIHDAGAVVAVDAAAGTITVTTAIPAAGALAGARVRVRLGAQVTMSEFGTAEIDAAEEWGYEGTFLGATQGLLIGKEIDIEIRFVGAAGGGLTSYDCIRAVIVECADG